MAESTNGWAELDAASTVSMPIVGGLASALVALYYSYKVQSVATDKFPVAEKIAKMIQDGARAFLVKEYKVLSVFCLVCFVLICIFLDFKDGMRWPVTGTCFLLGAFLSALCGWLGMSIATAANVRTAIEIESDPDEGLNRGLKVAFQSGSVMALSVVACGLLGFSFCYLIFEDSNRGTEFWNEMTGFAFGASSIALFARIGGGIYTKAADVGADLVGKVEEDLEEDDMNNPATIADNVGDNVGDVAGMGADLFESFVGSLIAAATIGDELYEGDAGVALPFWIAGIGALCSIVGTFMVKTNSADMKQKLRGLTGIARREAKLNSLLGSIRFAIYGASAFVVVGCALAICICFGFNWVGGRLYLSIICGLVCGNLIGYVTEYSTAYTEYPTKTIVDAASTGSATVIIQGLGVGMLSSVAPAMFLVICMLASFELSGVYGISVAAVGMLSTLGVTLATDAYGPVADNAGGIAEMAEDIPDHVREETDSLDALGNTTAATGKGFAIGSAVLTALALMNAFAAAADLTDVNMLQMEVLSGVLIGALSPFVFAALTMLSVGKAAFSIMYECRRQMNQKYQYPSYQLDPAQCVAISTEASLREMVAPGTLAIVTPVFIGFLLGSKALLGLLTGAISSGFILAVTMSNAGGAWDNAKKFVETNKANKGTMRHKAVVVGDTVGDPFKDTSGPALNILIKLMTVISLLLAPLFNPEPWVDWFSAVVIFVVTAIFLWVFTKYTGSEKAEAYYKEIDDEAKIRKAGGKVVTPKEKDNGQSSYQGDKAPKTASANTPLLG